MQDRCAEGRYQPRIEPENLQNWHLIQGSESGGWTTLEFWRLLGAQNGPCDLSIDKVIHQILLFMCSAFVYCEYSSHSKSLECLGFLTLLYIHTCSACKCTVNQQYYIICYYIHVIAYIALYSRSMRRLNDVSTSLYMLQGVTSIIYAWGDSDPVNEMQASYHESRRGTQGIAILPSDEIATDLSGSENFYLTVTNVSNLYNAAIASA